MDVSSLSTDVYDWTIQLTQHYSDSSTQAVSVTGDKKVINTLDSAMAPGWFPHGVSYLVADGSDVMLMRSGMQRFESDGNGGWTHQDFHDTNAYTLTGSWSTGFTLTAKDGTVDEFNTSGQITSSTDPGENETTYTYTSGKLTTITHPDTSTTTFTYDQQTGNLSSITTADGITSTYTHDANGRITAITKPDPDGSGPLAAPTTSLAYDTNGMLSTITYPDGGVESYAYDHALRLERVTRADDSEDTYVSMFAAALVDTSGGDGSQQSSANLIGAGDMEIVTTVGGVTTTADVDTWGYPVNAVNGEGHATQYLRNSKGQVLKRIEPDPDGTGPLSKSITTYNYDGKGNLIRTALPDGSTRQWEYDDTWNKTTRYIDEDGNVTLYAIDADNGQMVSKTVVIGNLDGLGNSEEDDLTTSYTYTDSSDSTLVGLLESVTDSTGMTTEYQYNSRGQKTKVTYAKNTDQEAVVESEYDGTTGDLVAQTDELGRRTEYVYDALRRKVATILPAADTTGTTIDDGDTTGFTTVGTWTSGGSGAYLYAANGSGSSTATWEFTGLDSDKYYEVFVTWSEDSSNATDAPFTVYDGTTGSGTALETVDLDQSEAPEGSRLIGDSWNRLGTYALSGTTLSVQLTNDADGQVIADSVRILEHSITETVYDSGGRVIQRIDEAGRATDYGYDARRRQTHVHTQAADATGTDVDDGDSDFTTSGTWTTDSTQGEGGDLRYAPSGTGTATATWTFDELDPHGRYLVLVTWVKDATNNATDAPFTVYDGDTSTGTLR